jgi:cation-transporting P-type ATPase 13A2
VLGVAYKELPEYNPNISDEQLETDLIFLGFLIFENKIKQPITSETISKLNASQMISRMCTGDNPITALNVANEVGMLGHFNTMTLFGEEKDGIIEVRLK